MKTNTDELLVFVTVIDSGSMTATAETLTQTVSGVSRMLTRLGKSSMPRWCGARPAGCN